MDSLTKVVVILAAIGVLGAALFFFPKSPMYFDKVRTIIITKTVPATDEQTTQSPDVEAVPPSDSVIEENAPDTEGEGAEQPH
ncbi:MAG: hypothetical protein H6863_02495 [Rhodospirillales bacterium]|nr:hypothetical protein [Rhodospirillales bacterium]